MFVVGSGEVMQGKFSTRMNTDSHGFCFEGFVGG